MNRTEFATLIKTKHPEYKDIDNEELVNRVVDKYPEYKSQIDAEATPTESKKSFLHQKPGRIGLLDSLAKFVTGKTQEQIEKPYGSIGEALPDVIRMSAFGAAPFTGGSSIPEGMALTGVLNGGTEMAANIAEGKTLKESAVNGLEAGEIGALLSGAFGVGGKVISKAYTASKPAIKDFLTAIGSTLSSIPREGHFDDVMANPRILKGPEAKTRAIEKASYIASDAYQKMIDSIKSTEEGVGIINQQKIKDAADRAKKAYESVEKSTGKQVGKERLKLVDKIGSDEVDPSEVYDQITHFLHQNVIDDPTGKELRVSGKELALIKDIQNRLKPVNEVEQTFQKEWPGIEKDLPPGYADNPKLLEKIKSQFKQGLIDQGLSPEDKNISAAKLDNIIQHIDNSVQYIGNPLKVSDKTSTGEYWLTQIRHNLNKVLAENEPKFSQVKGQHSDLKGIKETLGTNFTSYNTIKNLLSKYPEGLHPKEIDAIKKLEKMSGTSILDSIKPDEVPMDTQTLKKLMELLPQLNRPKAAYQFLKGVRNQPEPIMNALGEIDKNSPFLKQIQDQLSSEPFYKWSPGQGGGSGSAEGYKNILRGAGFTGLAGTHHPILAALLAASSSPRMNAFAIQGRYAAKEGLEKIAPSLGQIAKIAKTMIPPTVVRAEDGTLDDMYQKYMEKRRNSKVPTSNY